MADLLNSPQISLPFRVVGDRVVEHEQDSDTDVEQNATTILRYEHGQRSNSPRFGISDLAFTMGQVDVKAIVAIVKQFEPEADIQMVQTIIAQGVFDIDTIIGRVRANG